MPHCLNKTCKEELVMSRDWFCPSCKFIGRTGMAVGAFVVGVVVGLLKLWKVI